MANKEKPILIALGSGNGSNTISNTKGCSPKGPISKLIFELSKYCIVIMTPEYNTSQLCSECGNYLEDVLCFHYPSNKKISLEIDKQIKDINNNDEKERTKKQLRDEITKNIKIVKKESRNIHKLKKLKIGNTDISELSLINKKIEDKEETVFQTGYYKASYRLRRCANKHEHSSKRCALWYSVYILFIYKKNINTKTYSHLSHIKLIIRLI